MPYSATPGVTDHGALSGLADDDHSQYHNDARGDARYILLADKGIADGVAELDGSGKVPVAQLPAIAITNTYVVADQTAMLALAAQTGDVAVRTDESKSYILAGSDPATLGDWQELSSPTDQVQSVFGRSGTVVSANGDYNAGQITFTPAGNIVATTVQAAIAELDGDKAAKWTPVATANYTATPASTSQITMADTAGMAVGLPLRYTYGGTAYYGIVTAVVTDTSVTIAGAPLDTGSDLTALEIGLPSLVRQLALYVPSTYGDGTGALLASDSKTYERWQGSAAYLVQIAGVHVTADTGASQPKVNVSIGGDDVSTEDTNNGIQLSTAGTWVTGSAVAINTTNYAVARGDAIDVECNAAGTNGDAADLTMQCVFVIE